MANEMNRRSFVLAGASVLGMGAMAMAGCSSQTTETAEEPAEQATPEATAEAPATETAAIPEGATAGTVTSFIDMTGYETGKIVRAWIPVPQDFSYQTITNVSFSADEANTAEITEDELGNKMLYVEWTDETDAAKRVATVTFHAVREAVTCPELVEDGEPGDDVAEYLTGSEMVPVNDQVTTSAEEVTAGQDTYLGKARAIYDWIIANMNRDEEVVGCGQGDVCTLLDTKAGKCTDINSVFVGLCRAAGIPAREMFGVRMNSAKITGNQHCWAEFYLPGTGWVSADPADVLKAVLKNGWEKDSAECKEKQEFFWGNLDSERVELSTGRDLTLSPAQDGKALNDFGYPYAEVDGEPVDFYDPANFKYTLTFAKDAE